jgi:hypothetical protein
VPTVLGTSKGDCVECVFEIGYGEFVEVWVGEQGVEWIGE